MATPIHIQLMPEFNPDAEIGASLATRWQTWITDFKMYLLTLGITDVTRKQALLLYQSGSRVQEIFNQLPPLVTEENEEPGDKCETAKAQLTAYFEPQKNRRYEDDRFRQTTQAAFETLNQYHMCLHTMAQTCEFQDRDFEIEEQIIIGGSSSRIRKWAPRDPTYNLATMLLDGRRDESSTYQARKIEEKEPLSAETNQFQQKKGNTGKSCRNCGGNYPHKGACPAKGKQCRKCLKNNHFAAVCQGRSTKAEKPSHPPSGNTKHNKKKHIHPIQHETDKIQVATRTIISMQCRQINQVQKLMLKCWNVSLK